MDYVVVKLGLFKLTVLTCNDNCSRAENSK